MTPRPGFALGDALVPAGTRRTVDLPVSVLSDHTPVTMSAHVIHGRRPGPGVFVTAGIHGDEVIGVEIVRRLLSLPALAALAGTLIAIPIVNAFGFLNLSRYLPDRRDLNRCFPGSAGGSMAGRLADLLTREVVARADLGIDLHSAAVHRTNLPQIRVAPGDDEVLRLAAVFAAPVVLPSALRDGSLRQTAREMGVDMLLYEAGKGLRFDETAVRAGVAGILRGLHDRGMIGGRGVPRARRAPLVCRSSRWLRAPQGGCRALTARKATSSTGAMCRASSRPPSARSRPRSAPASMASSWAARCCRWSTRAMPSFIWPRSPPRCARAIGSGPGMRGWRPSGCSTRTRSSSPPPRPGGR